MTCMEVVSERPGQGGPNWGSGAGAPAGSLLAGHAYMSQASLLGWPPSLLETTPFSSQGRAPG